MNTVLTGMRTTGPLHLGHYVGALKQWIEAQDSGRYNCFFLLADVQALTTHADRPERLREAVRQVTLDWLAVGLDPMRPNVHFVLQSQVPGRADLSIALSMVAKYNEVLRDPTLKTELAQLEEGGKSASLGFVCYPVDQAADINMVDPMDGSELLVPVGEDQVPHLELQRGIIRDFNRQYGKGKTVLTVCKALVGDVGRLVGTDGGAKMSKSLGNTIDLADDPRTVEAKVRRMFTDPNRKRADMPGETENNPVFIYHRAFNPNKEEVADLTARYQAGKVGDVEVKAKLATALNNFLDPIRERRARFRDVDIHEILEEGTKVAGAACQSVVEVVRERMALVYP